MQRCYCGHSNSSSSGRGCGGGGGGGSGSGVLKPMTNSQRQSRSDLSTLTSSQKSVHPTQFIKRSGIKHDCNMGPELGLGHSNSELSGNFSRRNSTATTVSHCSSCCSSCGASKQEQRQQQQSRVKVLSWGSERRLSSGGSGGSCDHTDNRRHYEQRACANLTAEGQGWTIGTATPSPTLGAEPHNDELQRLLALQQFRLLNASECFSTERQDELRLQRAYDNIGGRADEEQQHAKWRKNKANESRQQSTNAATTTSTMPYALRQKLLQLQLQAEEAERGDSVDKISACAPVDKSCALRFNCR